MATAAQLEFTCPRCGGSAAAEYYGPCDDCRAELRAAMGREPTSEAAPAARFEPKVNVVANHVAASRNDT